jgi:perosamine synthetase
VSGPWITDREVAYAADAARTGWYETAGVYPQRFERAFADYLGVRHAVTVPHCTAAIHLSLVALGVGPGDEVVVPDATWIASAAPVTYVGATPVFADVDPATWCLDAASLDRCVTPRTKAVIPVDLYGGMPDWDAIRRVARAHGIAVIEDAAEAVGSEYKGRKAGSLGDTGVFSFHGSKTLTTGEGGMFVTDRDDLYQRVLTLRDHGRPKGDRLFQNTEVAFKYKMSAMQAAVGLAQLERVEELIARKRLVFDWYVRRLGGHPRISLNAEPAGTKNTYWMVTALFDDPKGRSKTDWMAALSEHGIDTRPFFHPLSSLTAYAGNPHSAGARNRNPVAYRVSRCGINLPSGLNLTEADVDYVCGVVRSLLDA